MNQINNKEDNIIFRVVEKNFVFEITDRKLFFEVLYYDYRTKYSMIQRIDKKTKKTLYAKTMIAYE